MLLLGIGIGFVVTALVVGHFASKETKVHDHTKKRDM